jgi:predicted RNA-binding protein with RPS1 domain
VKCIGIDAKTGKIRLSRREAMADSEKAAENRDVTFED